MNRTDCKDWQPSAIRGHCQPAMLCQLLVCEREWADSGRCFPYLIWKPNCNDDRILFCVSAYLQICG
jgi:hypothetical protein